MALPFDGFIADMARVAEELGLAATSAKSMPDSQPSRFVMFVQATLKVFRDDIAAVDIDELLRIRAEQYDGMDARAMRVLIDGEIEAQPQLDHALLAGVDGAHHRHHRSPRPRSFHPGPPPRRHLRRCRPR